MKTRIFLTGATGYVGNQLALGLARKGFEVMALVRNPEAKTIPQHTDIHVLKGDLLDYDSILRASKGCSYTFHAAAFTKLTCRSIDPYYDINVKGTENVLRASQHNGIRKVVHTSSVSVLGPSINGVLLSETQPRMRSYDHNYEITKALAEENVRQYSKAGLPGVILNVSRVYGPGPEGFSNGINQLLQRALRCKYFWIPDRLEHEANYVYIEDVVHAHISALEKGKPGESYIIGGENASYATLFHAIRETVGVPYKYIAVNYTLLRSLFAGKSAVECMLCLPPGVSPKLLDYLYTDRRVDINKAKSHLGYPVTPLKEGLRLTLNTLKP